MGVHPQVNGAGAHRGTVRLVTQHAHNLDSKAITLLIIPCGRLPPLEPPATRREDRIHCRTELVRKLGENRYNNDTWASRARQNVSMGSAEREDEPASLRDAEFIEAEMDV